MPGNDQRSPRGLNGWIAHEDAHVRGPVRGTCQRKGVRRDPIAEVGARMRALWTTQCVTFEVRIVTYTRGDKFESALQIAVAEVAVAP